MSKPTRNKPAFVTTYGEWQWNPDTQRYELIRREGYRYDGPWALAHPKEPVWVIQDYRWRNDDGSESTATWAETLNTARTTGTAPGETLRLRMNFGETGAADTNNTGSWTLEYRVNTGGGFGSWTTVPTTTGSDVYLFNSTNLTNGTGITTERLGTNLIVGSVFTSGYGDENEDGVTPSQTWSDNYGEAEFALTFASGRSANDVFEFRLESPQTAVYPTPTNTPTITLASAATNLDLDAGTATLSTTGRQASLDWNIDGTAATLSITTEDMYLPWSIFEPDGNGDIWIEAEHWYRRELDHPDGTAWEIRSDVTAEGGQYIRGTGATGFYTVRGSGPWIEYLIRTTDATSNYNVYTRGGDGEESINDSYWPEIIGSVYESPDTAHSANEDGLAWRWSPYYDGRKNLSVPPGVHILRIYMRERYVNIDRFLVSNVPYQPSPNDVTGDAESSRTNTLDLYVGAHIGDRVQALGITTQQATVAFTTAANVATLATTGRQATVKLNLYVSATNDTTLSPELLAWWRFDNDQTDETGGYSATVQSGTPTYSSTDKIEGTHSVSYADTEYATADASGGGLDTSSSDQTWCCRLKITDPGVFSYAVDVGPVDHVQFKHDSGNNIDIRIGNGLDEAVTNADVGRWYNLTGIVEPGHATKKLRYYVDGVEVNSYGSTPTDHNIDTIYFGSPNTASGVNSIAVDDVRAYDRVLTDDEVDRWANNRLPGYGAPNVSITGRQAAVELSSGLDIDANAATLTTTGQQAALDWNIDANAAALTATGQQAAVAISIPAGTSALTTAGQQAALDWNIDAVTQSLSFTGRQATVQLDRNISASTQSLTTTGRQASLFLGANLDIDAGTTTVTTTGRQAGIEWNIDTITATVTTTGRQASLFLGANLDIDAGTATVTTTGRQAGIEWNIDAGTATVTTTGRQASLFLGVNLDIDGIASAVPLTARNASVQTGADLDIDAGTATLTTTGRQAGIEWNIDTSTVTVTTTGRQAALFLGANLDIDAGTATVTTTGRQASLFLGANLDIDAGTVSVPITARNASVQAGADLDVTANAATLTTTGRQASLDWNIDAGTQALTTTGRQATVQLQRNITAGDQALTLSPQSANVQAGQDLDLSAGYAALTLTIPSVQVNAALNVTAGVASLATSGAAAGLGWGIYAGAQALTTGEQSATLDWNIDAGTSALATTGQAGNITLAQGLIASTGELTLTGHQANITYSLFLSATSDSLTLVARKGNVSYLATGVTKYLPENALAEELIKEKGVAASIIKYDTATAYDPLTDLPAETQTQTSNCYVVLLPVSRGRRLDIYSQLGTVIDDNQARVLLSTEDLTLTPEPGDRLVFDGSSSPSDEWWSIDSVTLLSPDFREPVVLYTLGVTRGTPDSTFAPTANETYLDEQALASEMIEEAGIQGRITAYDFTGYDPLLDTPDAGTEPTASFLANMVLLPLSREEDIMYRESLGVTGQLAKLLIPGNEATFDPLPGHIITFDSKTSWYQGTWSVKSVTSLEPDRNNILYTLIVARGADLNEQVA